MPLPDGINIYFIIFQGVYKNTSSMITEKPILSIKYILKVGVNTIISSLGMDFYLKQLHESI